VATPVKEAGNFRSSTSILIVFPSASATFASKYTPTPVGIVPVVNVMAVPVSDRYWLPPFAVGLAANAEWAMRHKMMVKIFHPEVRLFVVISVFSVFVFLLPPVFESPCGARSSSSPDEDHDR
jgi:hypothetical protein